MKQSFYQFLTFIIILAMIIFTLAIPFFYLWNWLFVKFFYFDYIDYLECRVHCYYGDVKIFVDRYA